jgi:hypothetical protein
MLFSWGFILILALFCFARILRSGLGGKGFREDSRAA